jgi:hypothetical protein
MNESTKEKGAYENESRMNALFILSSYFAELYRNRLLTMFRILFLLCFITITSYSQDTIKVKSSYYGRIQNLTYDGANSNLTNRFLQMAEFGKSFSVLDIGLAVGYKGGDSVMFMPKLTLDASQYQFLSNEYSIGIGYYAGSETPLVFDISSTILAQISKKIAIGINAGFTDYSGDNNSYTRNYLGFIVRIGLLRDFNGLLTKTTRMRFPHPHGR